ncbi:hypothetical protein TI39_contig695g00006 [Zymoseptoria brevis]|uniref:WD-like domain-containing protein n=1 Tax=Zymoseptoria brevis TaxID=1047168 RepID=A0A0F4GJ53_9PEZI|nr:hypothetical protein TI39_contig695g00006 [Zymoseptoria brevis]
MPTIVNAGCQSAQLIRGRVHAHCTDETSGQDFTYIDMDDDFLDHMVGYNNVGAVSQVEAAHLSSSDLYSRIYAMYKEAGQTAEPTSPNVQHLQKRFTNFFRACRQRIVGACSSDHAIQWAGTASSFIENVVSVISEVNTNKREAKNPRSICLKKKEVSGLKSRLCVSWAVTEYQDMGNDQIDAIARECETKCQEVKKSCEVTIVASGNVLNYFCISDRPDGCTSDNNIGTCP